MDPGIKSAGNYLDGKTSVFFRFYFLRLILLFKVKEPGPVSQESKKYG